MRLIDADAIIDYLNKRKEVIERTFLVDDDYIRCIDETVNVIEKQPEVKIESKISDTLKEGVQMKRYLRHLSFRNGDGFDVENWVNSDEFKNCELITISTYVDDEMDIVHELWYWFIVE